MGALWCSVVQTQPGTFQLGNSRQSSCPQPTAHPAQGWQTQTASACPAGHQAAGSQMCNHLLCPAYEEASPAENQALCPRLNKMDLGCKVQGWDKPELLGAASSEQPHPAVPVLGQGLLATQNGSCCRCYTSTQWCECSHWERQVLEKDTKTTCPWKNGI